MRKLHSRIRIFLLVLAFGLAAVPFFNALHEKWIDASISLPQTESASPIYVFPRKSDEMPHGGGSGPDCYSGHDADSTGDSKLLKNIDLHETNLRRADFSGVNINSSVFNNADLRGANFSTAIIFFSGFINTDLSNADFTGAKIHGSDLTKANLTKAKFIRANLTHSDLGNAILINADLTDANLSDANLETAVGLTYEQIKKAVINKSTSLPLHLKSKSGTLFEKSKKRVKELRKIMSEEEQDRYIHVFNFLD